jgi:hypothetical protein
LFSVPALFRERSFIAKKMQTKRAISAARTMRSVLKSGEDFIAMFYGSGRSF